MQQFVEKTMNNMFIILKYLAGVYHHDKLLAEFSWYLYLFICDDILSKFQVSAHLPTQTYLVQLFE